MDDQSQSLNIPELSSSDLDKLLNEIWPSHKSQGNSNISCTSSNETMENQLIPPSSGNFALANTGPNQYTQHTQTTAPIMLEPENHMEKLPSYINDDGNLLNPMNQNFTAAASNTANIDLITIKNNSKEELLEKILEKPKNKHLKIIFQRLGMDNVCALESITEENIDDVMESFAEEVKKVNSFRVGYRDVIMDHIKRTHSETDIQGYKTPVGVKLALLNIVHKINGDVKKVTKEKKMPKKDDLKYRPEKWQILLKNYINKKIFMYDRVKSFTTEVHDKNFYVKCPLCEKNCSVATFDQEWKFESSNFYTHIRRCV